MYKVFSGEAKGKVYLLYNRLSKDNIKKERFEYISNIMRKNNISPELIIVPENKFLPNFKHNDVLCIFGGDGTIHRTITKIIKTENTLPFIAHLKGGSMNTIADGIGVKIERVMEGIKNKNVFYVERPSLEVSFSDKVYGMIFGDAVISEFLENYYEGGNTGPIKGIKTLIKAVLESFIPKEKKILKRTFARIEINGKVFERKWAFFAVSSIHTLGLKSRILKKAPLYDDKFEVVLSSHDFRLLGILIIPEYFGFLPPGTISEVSDRVKVEFENVKNFTLDGDIYEAKTIEIKVGPKIKFVV